MRYLVYCGNPTPNGFMWAFQYLEQAPASLCKPHTDKEPGPDPDDNGVFITSLIERHNDEILHSHAWRCVTCHKPAKELLHSAVPLLSPNSERALPGFEPTVLDFSAPNCMSGGACDREAEKSLHEFATSSLLHESWKIERSKTCDKCGRKSGVKLCGGCKHIA
jgi:hypothetical protein